MCPSKDHFCAYTSTVVLLNRGRQVGEDCSASFAKIIPFLRLWSHSLLFSEFQMWDTDSLFFSVVGYSSEFCENQSISPAWKSNLPCSKNVMHSDIRILKDCKDKHCICFTCQNQTGRSAWERNKTYYTCSFLCFCTLFEFT